MLWRKRNCNEERERDFVFLLQHKLDIEHADGKHETRINTLCDYGDPKAFSAMARLVDIPCGLAVVQVCEGRLLAKGAVGAV